MSRFVRIPLADGRVLSARLWLEDGETPVPAILEFRPYRGFDLFRPLEDQYLPAWAEHGYAVLAVDIAGSGQSTGELHDEYLTREIEDAVAVVQWCAEQSWCDGQVGLSGMSWSAFTALRVSSHRPPALKAMALGGVSEDGWRTDIHNLGGASYTARVDWAGVMLMFNALPPDPLEFGEGWRDEWLARLAVDRPWIEPWLSHPARDAFWADKAFTPGPDAPDLPLLLYSGWADKYATSVLRIASGWRGPVRTIIGPWEHTVPDLARRRPRIDYLGEALRWWDQWLKGSNRGVLDAPPLRAWIGGPDRDGLTEDGRWAASAWPADGVPIWALRLADVGRLSPEAGADTVIRLIPAPKMPDTLSVDRYEDAPGAFDLAAVERAGAYVGLTDPMTEDVEILGQPVLALLCRSDQESGLIVARLVDVDPQGAAVRMTTGALNLVLRADPSQAMALTPGAWTDITVELQAIGWRLRAGHRLGLVLSAEGWPTLWPGRRGTEIELSSAATELNAPLAAPTGIVEMAAPKHVGRAEVDKPKWIDPDQERLVPTGLSGAAFETRSAHHLPATGTDYLSASRFEVALEAGGREARAVKVSRTAFERPGWSIRVDTRLAVTSTPETFDIEWSVRAEHDGVLAHDRKGRSSVPRTAA